MLQKVANAARVERLKSYPSSACFRSFLKKFFFLSSFQAHKDRLAVAVTCGNLLKKVETFSERKWKEIRPMADASWEERIHDRSSIETDRHY